MKTFDISDYGKLLEMYVYNLSKNNELTNVFYTRYKENSDELCEIECNRLSSGNLYTIRTPHSSRSIKHYMNNSDLVENYRNLFRYYIKYDKDIFDNEKNYLNYMGYMNKIYNYHNCPHHLEQDGFIYRMDYGDHLGISFVVDRDGTVVHDTIRNKLHIYNNEGSIKNLDEYIEYYDFGIVKIDNLTKSIQVQYFDGEIVNYDVFEKLGSSIDIFSGYYRRVYRDHDIGALGSYFIYYKGIINKVYSDNKYKDKTIYRYETKEYDLDKSKLIYSLYPQAVPLEFEDFKYKYMSLYCLDKYVVDEFGYSTIQRYVYLIDDVDKFVDTITNLEDDKLMLI